MMIKGIDLILYDTFEINLHEKYFITLHNVMH